MAPGGKVNYRSYEAQARLVRALVAAHPEVKWNYKEICKCYGSDMTENALNHRFRRLRAQSVIIREAAKQNYDMKDLESDENALPGTQGDIDLSQIAKYFGASTADGIQFQFRTIKKDADTLRATAEHGGDLANCLNLGTGTGGGGVSTPSRNGSTPSKRARKTPAKKKTLAKSVHDDSDEDFAGYSDEDESPAKRGRTGDVKKEEEDSGEEVTSIFGNAKPHKSFIAPQYEYSVDDDEDIEGEI